MEDHRRLRLDRTVFLPEEIVIEIITRLPVKSILRCRCVSKRLKYIIDSRSFKLQHQRLGLNKNKNNLMFSIRKKVGSGYPLDWNQWHDDLAYVEHEDMWSVWSWSRMVKYYKPKLVEISYPHTTIYSKVEFVGSSNGLICLCINERYDHKDDVVCIWNPTTGDFVDIPLMFEKSTRFDNTLVAGYANETFIRILNDGIYKFKLGIGGQLQIQSTDYFFEHERSKGVFLEGHLHWIGLNKNESLETIIRVDINDLTMGILPFPSGVSPIARSSYHIECNYRDEAEVNNKCVSVLDGKLCLLVRHNVEWHKSFINCSLYVMEVYEDAGSWVLKQEISQFHISNSYFIRPKWSLDPRHLLVNCNQGLFYLLHVDIADYVPRDPWLILYDREEEYEEMPVRVPGLVVCMM